MKRPVLENQNRWQEKCYIGGSKTIFVEFELRSTRNDATGSVSVLLPESAVPQRGMTGASIPGGGRILEELPFF